MDYKYDIMLSFAGEDREYVEKVAEILVENNVKVFYDKFEEDELWGKDLGIHFEIAYSRSAKYFIPFISENYKKKNWTNYEFRNAIARAIMSKEDYILPARFDDTQIDGLRTTIAHIDLRKKSPEQFAKLIIKKLEKESNCRIFKYVQEKVAEINLSQTILSSGYQGIFVVEINVTITNMRKEYRYFEEPYFKISNELEGKFDTFYLTEIMDRKSFPIKLEWGQRITVKFELKPAGIAQLKVLPHDTTLKAIVSTTINEISESNKLYISDL